MSKPQRPSRAGALVTIGVAAFALLCCAAPALLAGGALAGIGGAFSSPWLIVAGAGLAVSSVAITIIRRARRHSTNEASCRSTPASQPRH